VSDFRAIVLGLGGIGSASAYWLSRRLGEEVLGIEQFELGHGRGASEDHSRIIRLSYHTPGYVEMAKSAYEAWETLEVESGEQVVLRTGGLDLASPSSVIGLDAYRTSMVTAGVSFEELEAVEVMKRWPQWRLPKDVMALYQGQSGIAMAARANQAHRSVAIDNGATLIDTAPVTSIREVGGEVEVVAADKQYRAETLVVAAGAWTNRLLSHVGVEFPLDVTLEQVVYLDPLDGPAFHPSRFPIWIWMDVPCFYGFPIFGEPAVKVAWDRCEVVTDADTRTFHPDPEATTAIKAFTDEHLPTANGGVRLAKTCLYTLTPDRDFVIDRVPGTDRIFTAIGAGHAFKFASLIGRLLCDLSQDGTTDLDLSAFAADRAILKEENPVRTYMV
jgi:sarcosine oxidase